MLGDFYKTYDNFEYFCFCDLIENQPNPAWNGACVKRPKLPPLGWQPSSAVRFETLPHPNPPPRSQQFPEWLTQDIICPQTGTDKFLFFSFPVFHFLQSYQGEHLHSLARKESAKEPAKSSQQRRQRRLRQNSIVGGVGHRQAKQANNSAATQQK